MINSEQVRELFPFSIGLDTELRVTSLGRSLHKRLGDSTSRLFSDLFELPRWIGAFDHPVSSSKDQCLDQCF